MKINQNKIQSSINLNPTKKSQSMSIQELCRQIEKKEITIPMYQRGLSWNHAKVVDLLNYQLFGKAPVAPLSFNEIDNNHDVPQLEFISRKPVSEIKNGNEKYSVIDGQQRLTSNYKAYSNDPDFETIVFDVTRPAFKEIKTRIQKNQIPVGILLNKKQETLSEYLIDNYPAKEYSELFPLLLGVRTKLLSYMYTIHIANDMNEKEQIEWFEVLNNAGSRVSMIELKLSKLKLHDFDIYNEFIIPYQQKVAEYGFEDLFSPFSSNVSYPIASLNPAYELIIRNGVHNKNYAPIPSDTKEGMLLNLTTQELNNIKNLTLSSLTQSLDFIFDMNLQEYITQMQYVMYLTGYFIFNQNKQVSYDKLATWVKETSFTNLSNGDRRELFNNLITNNF